MDVKERLIKMLREEYGITNQQELEDAIKKQKKLDISVFVSPPPKGVKGNNGKND